MAWAGLRLSWYLSGLCEVEYALIFLVIWGYIDMCL